jgi:hypothetical protein
VEREGSLQCSQEPAIGPCTEPDKLPWSFLKICPILRPCVTFHNKFFYGEELLDPHPSPKLEDHPLSATCYFSSSTTTTTTTNHHALGFRPLRLLKPGSSTFSLGGPDFFFQ